MMSTSLSTGLIIMDSDLTPQKESPWYFLEDPIPYLQITVARSTVTQVPSLNYLGVTVTSNLSWSADIDNMRVKPKKQLGLLYHNFHMAGRICPGCKNYCLAPVRLLCLCVKNNITLTVTVCIALFEAIGELQREKLCQSRAATLNWN